MVGDLPAKGLLVPCIHLDVGIRLRPLRTKTQPHTDVIGEVDLLARGARDELGALAFIDVEGDSCAGHHGLLVELSDGATSRTPTWAHGLSRQALSRRATATASAAVRTPSLASRRASRSRT